MRQTSGLPTKQLAGQEDIEDEDPRESRDNHDVEMLARH